MRRLVIVALILGGSACRTHHDQPKPSQTIATAPPSAVRRAPLSAAGLSPLERAVGARMRATREVTVEVEMRLNDEVVGHGSGVFVSSNGDVLTAAHVVDKPLQHFRVILPNGKTREGHVVAIDEAHDSALLHTAGEPTPFAPTVREAPKAGDWVVCTGYAGGVAEDRIPVHSAGVVAENAFAWSVTEYKASRHFPEPVKTSTYQAMLQTDCATAPGMSGGPVVDLDGHLVGVVVGSGGVVSPISAIRPLVAKAAPPPETLKNVGSIELDRAQSKDGKPSRDSVLEPMLAGVDVKRSLVTLEAPTAARNARSFGVVVSRDGLVIAPSIRIMKTTEPMVPVAASEITVEEHPDAKCVEVVAVRGELALLRFTGLDEAAGVSPIGEASTPQVGEAVAAVGPGTAARSVGFVTAEDRHPGIVAPEPPRGGCGTMQMYFVNSHPPVHVESALVHDAGWPSFGSLLVDQSGHPVAIDVATRATGLSFAIPWSDALARFDEWLAPPSP